MSDTQITTPFGTDSYVPTATEIPALMEVLLIGQTLKAIGLGFAGMVLPQGWTQLGTALAEKMTEAGKGDIFVIYSDKLTDRIGLIV